MIFFRLKYVLCLASTLAELSSFLFVLLLLWSKARVSCLLYLFGIWIVLLLQDVLYQSVGTTYSGNQRTMQVSCIPYNINNNK